MQAYIHYIAFTCRHVTRVTVEGQHIRTEEGFDGYPVWEKGDQGTWLNPIRPTTYSPFKCGICQRAEKAEKAEEAAS